MGLLDRIKKASEIALEASKEAANKTVEIAEKTKNAYKDGGAEAVGKLAGSATKTMIEGAKIAANNVSDYTKDVGEAGVKTGNKASMVYSDNNKVSQDITRGVLTTIGAIRKVALDGKDVARQAIEKMDEATSENRNKQKP